MPLPESLSDMAAHAGSHIRCLKQSANKISVEKAAKKLHDDSTTPQLIFPVGVDRYTTNSSGVQVFSLLGTWLILIVGITCYDNGTQHVPPAASQVD